MHRNPRTAPDLEERPVVEGPLCRRKYFITPPFTQLNTAYPASPYLKGFLKSQGYDVFQADLGIELINKVFSRKGFQELFAAVNKNRSRLSQNSLQIMNNESSYADRGRV
jgi:hypothetical protein